MLSGILEIGKTIIGSGDYLKSKVILEKNETDKSKIVRIVFHPKDKIIKIVPEEFDQSKCEKYLWVGNCKGTLPQTRLTSNDITKIFVDSIFNAYERIENGELKEILKDIIDKFTCQKRKKGKTIRVIDISLIEDIDQELKNEWEEKDNVEDMGDLLSKYIANKLSISKKFTSKLLYTVFYEDKSLVQFKEYKDMLLEEFTEKAFEKSKFGVCHGCGKESELTKDFSTFELKFFITDKINFASGINKEGFYKNFALCDECFKSFGAGERFLKNYLRTKFANVSYTCYVIPEFYDISTIPSISVLVKRAERTIRTVQALNSVDKWKEYREALEEKIGTEAFAINFVFAEEQNAAVKIKKLIMDVPPSRIEEIISKRRSVYEKFINLIFGDPINDTLKTADIGELDFDRIFYLFPVRRDLPNIILEIYDSILTKKPLSERELAKLFLEVVTIYYYEKYNNYYHLKPRIEPTWKVIYHILASNQFLLYACQIDVLHGGDEKMAYEELDNIDSDLRNYVEELKLDEQKTGLFLLGVLLSEIARVQESKGDGKKVVLEKLNYYGMPQSKIKILSNEIFEKLKQYKVLNKYTELIYAFAKKYLDKNDRDWTLSPQENVYWIKSGYAYRTMKIKINSKKMMN
ncbi:MAG: TIGR02556 family CRISPR-associated protein [Fervidobacterium sp.]|nr:TIGR02556 family CRISPR-associated protein [Fervidobacterium sp.]